MAVKVSTSLRTSFAAIVFVAAPAAAGLLLHMKLKAQTKIRR